MLPLINSGGFLVSAMPASTKPQFATGPQKCTVRGPVGLSSSALNLDPRDPALAAMPAELTAVQAQSRWPTPHNASFRRGGTLLAPHDVSSTDG